VGLLGLERVGDRECQGEQEKLHGVS
jgi:hypothetical protein